MKNIIVIRHTQSVQHTNGMVGGWTDWELTERGKKQAITIGKYLKNSISFDKYIMYTSDLKRAKQTADGINVHLGLNTIMRKELREINVGIETETTVKWFNENKKKHDDVVYNFDYRPFPNAESNRDLWHRVSRFMNEIIDSNDNNIIIVSHGVTLKFFLTMWLNDDFDTLKDSKIFVGIISKLSIDNNGNRTTESCNDFIPYSDSELDFDKAIRYVKSIFEQCVEHKKEYSYREKFSHTIRVYKWAKKLLETEIADSDVLLMAAIFHDVGYTIDAESHMSYSADICRSYFIENKYDDEYIDMVCEIITHHNERPLLYKKNTSIEQILLIEADGLDESGAVSILRDTLSEGLSEDVSYKRAYKRICEHPLSDEKINLFCVTSTSRKIWKQKQDELNMFIRALERDFL